MGTDRDLSVPIKINMLIFSVLVGVHERSCAMNVNTYGFTSSMIWPEGCNPGQVLPNGQNLSGCGNVPR